MRGAPRTPPCLVTFHHPPPPSPDVGRLAEAVLLPLKHDQRGGHAARLERRVHQLRLCARVCGVCVCGGLELCPAAPHKESRA